jgi:hypothetical protein
MKEDLLTLAVAGLIPNEAIGFLNLHNPSSHAVHLGLV